MTLSLVETDAGISYDEERGATIRLLALFFGFSSLATSGGFMWMIRQAIRQGTAIETASQLGGLLASVAAVVVFLAFAGFLLWLGAIAPVHSLFFDRRSRRITCIAFALIPWRKERIYGFTDVAMAEIVEHDHGDDGRSFSLRLTFKNGTRISLGIFHSRDSASEDLQRLRQLLALP